MAKDYSSNPRPIFGQSPVVGIAWTATPLLDDNAAGDTSTGVTDTLNTTTGTFETIMGRHVLNDVLQNFRFTVKDTPVQQSGGGYVIADNYTIVFVWVLPTGGSPWWNDSYTPGVNEYWRLARSPFPDVDTPLDAVLADFDFESSTVDDLRLVGVRDENGFLQCHLEGPDGHDLSAFGMNLIEIGVEIVHRCAIVSTDFPPATLTTEYSVSITDIRVNEGESPPDPPDPPDTDNACEFFAETAFCPARVAEAGFCPGRVAEGASCGGFAAGD